VQFDWIRSFTTVAETGSFTTAASSLYRSQPRVSAHIRALEQALNAQLFDRESRPVELTPAGRAFLPHAQRLMEDFRAACDDIGTLAGPETREVSLGVIPSASAAFIPNVLAGLADRLPRVRVRLFDLGTVELAEGFEEGRFDMILRPLSPPLRMPSVIVRPLWREPLQLAVPIGHELSRVPRPVQLEQVISYPLLTTGGQDSGSAIRNALDGPLGESVDLAYQVTQPQTLIELVRSGRGVGITNKLALSTANTDGIVVIDLDAPHGTRDVGLHWREHGLRSAAARHVRDAILASPMPRGCEPLGVDSIG
jgi:DNA-binding transcriptional LysR family regulator